MGRLRRAGRRGAGRDPAGAGPSSLDHLLDLLFRQTGRHAATLLRAGAAGLFLMAAVPWLARLPIELLERLRGLRLRPIDTRFGRQRYRARFVARCPAEELAPFRLLERTVRETALERAAPPAE